MLKKLMFIVALGVLFGVWYWGTQEASRVAPKDSKDSNGYSGDTRSSKGERQREARLKEKYADFAQGSDEFVPFAGYADIEPTPFKPAFRRTFNPQALSDIAPTPTIYVERELLKELQSISKATGDSNREGSFVDGEPDESVYKPGSSDNVNVSEEGGRSPSGLLSGVVTRAEIIPTTAPFKDDTAPEESTPDPKQEAPLRLGGQPRGYAMLHLMHPAARLTVEKQIETLLRADIEDIYIALLADGTFSWDFGYLSYVIRRLNDNARSLTLAIYLTNGSAMRNFRETPVRAPFAIIEPKEFRSLIRFNSSVRAMFQSLVRRIVPAFELNHRLNPLNRNIALVMLEDNLDRESYLAMRALAQDILGSRATFMRNPCPGCYEGNDTDPAGDGLEHHSLNEFAQLTSRDGFNLDGIGYTYPEDALDERPTTSEIYGLAEAAATKNLRYFGLWRHEWQGVRAGTLVHPDERLYRIPSETQILHDIDLLRAGLVPLE